MKKGFTLVELMAVLVLIVLISTIGYAGITAVQNNIDKNLWEGKVEAIETGAADYGEDNKNRLMKIKSRVCTVGAGVVVMF